MVLEHIDFMTISAIKLRISIIAGMCYLLVGCQTVKLPMLDIMKSPEFSEDAANIAKDYPRPKDAPPAPNDIRSDKQWDRDARLLEKLRDSSIRGELPANLSKAESEAEFETLKAKAQAYKNDDPVSGPVDGFPDYKPRR